MQLIDQFIQQVRTRLIIQKILPLVMVPIILYLFYLSVQFIINLFNYSIGLSFPLHSLITISIPGIIIYIFYIFEQTTQKATCIDIDKNTEKEKYRTSFLAYLEGKQQQPPPPDLSNITQRLGNLINENYYDERKIAPLIAPHFWTKMLLVCVILIIIWLLSLVFASFAFRKELLPASFNKEQPSQLEKHAREVQLNCKKGCTGDFAREVEATARQGRTGEISQEKYGELLKDHKVKIETVKEQLVDDRINRALDDAANVLSENMDTMPAGKNLYRRNLRQTAEELLKAHEEAIQNPDKALEIAKTFRAAAEKLTEGGLQHVDNRLTELADKTEQLQSTTEQEKEEIRSVFRDLEDRVHDVHLLADLEHSIDNELQRTHNILKARQKLDDSSSQLDSTLSVIVSELKKINDKQCHRISTDLEQTNKKYNRSIISEAELEKELSQSEERLKMLIAQTTDEEKKNNLMRILNNLQQAQEEFQYNSISFRQELYPRGRTSPGISVEFNPVSNNDRSGPRSDTTKPTLPPPVKQVGDSRVVRPLNSPKDLQIIKELYEKRHQ